MRILITGAAGNVGSYLAADLLKSPHQLHLMTHKHSLPQDLEDHPRARVFQSDLGSIETLDAPCRDVDCLVHLAGTLFEPFPETFLWKTNVLYVQNLTAVAIRQRINKFILISFPHVEGESTPESPARGVLDGNPGSVHAQTRLAAERHLLRACQGTETRAIVLRAGMIYGRELLMIRAATWLLRRRFLGVWRRPTWIHLLAQPDFHRCVRAAVERDDVGGIYNLGDEQPLTLQNFLDLLADYWGYPRPWRAPMWSFYLAAASVEIASWLLRRSSPLTRDFIRIGSASYASDTTRMKLELLDHLLYPTFRHGIEIL